MSEVKPPVRVPSAPGSCPSGEAADASSSQATAIPSREALRLALDYFRPNAATNGPVMLTPSKMRAHLAVIEAAVQPKLMQTELRPFKLHDHPGLDEVCADNVSVFHAEMMGDDKLWMGLSDEHNGLLHVWVTIEKHKGRRVLVMTAEDQDRPTVVDELDSLKAWRASAIEAHRAETGTGSVEDESATRRGTP